MSEKDGIRYQRGMEGWQITDRICEMWKAPVKDWIHDMYDTRQKKAEQKAKRKQQ